MAFCSFHSDRSPVDHPDLREEISIQAGVHTSPPLLVSTLPPLSISLSMVGIATGVRLVREGTVVCFSASLTLYLPVGAVKSSSAQQV